MIEDYKIETVMGKVSEANLDRILTHEHLASDFGKCYESVPGVAQPNEIIPFEEIEIITQYPYSNYYNMNLCDEEGSTAMLYDLRLLKQKNWYVNYAIVEQSSYGLNRKLSLLKTLSKTSDVSIIVGTGYYTASTQVNSILNMKQEDLYNRMLKDFEEGISEESDRCTNIKPAFIGEVGSTWPIHDFERRSISATGEIQEQLRCGVSFSPGISDFAPTEILRIYEEAGGDCKKAVMNHADCTFSSRETFMEFINETNCFIQFDLFGTEHTVTFKDKQFVAILTDAERIQLLINLMHQSHRILMSHDIHTKNRLAYYGGSGFNFIEENILEAMQTADIPVSDILKITVTNSKEWLRKS